MSTQIRAIYEHGVFRPLESVDLPERQEVTVTIDGNGANSTERADHVRFFLPPDRWQTFCEAPGRSVEGNSRAPRIVHPGEPV
jgi:predicted DNA-binding antitoxin AbrB/MazE fold protein